MKKYYIFYFLSFTSICLWGQNITTKIVDSIVYPKNKFKKFINVDNLGNYYFSNFEVITKVDNNNNWVYANYELGIPHSVSVTNPLQILLFYKETNIIVLLDRFLNEIQRIELNQINPTKIAWWVENTKNKEVWLYNSENNWLESYNYKQNQVLSQTIPFFKNPIDFSSNFNDAFVLFDKKINRYNIHGTLLQSSTIENVTTIKASNSNLIGKSENEFLLYTFDLKEIGRFKNPINNSLDFSLKNEKLYIYNGSKLYIYQLTLPTKLN